VLARKKGAMTLSAKRPRPASGVEDRGKGGLSWLSWGWVGRWAARSEGEEVDVAGRMKKPCVVEARSAVASSRVAPQKLGIGVVRMPSCRDCVCVNGVVMVNAMTGSDTMGWGNLW